MQASAIQVGQITRFLPESLDTVSYFDHNFFIRPRLTSFKTLKTTNMNLHNAYMNSTSQSIELVSRGFKMHPLAGRYVPLFLGTSPFSCTKIRAKTSPNSRLSKILTKISNMIRCDYGKTQNMRVVFL